MDTEKIYGSENRRKLFENLSKDGFELGSFEDFDRNMNDKNVRKSIHEAAIDAGWDLPEYGQFERDMTVRRMKIGGELQEVDHATYDDFMKRHSSGTQKRANPQPKSQQTSADPTTPAGNAPGKPKTPWGTEGSATGRSLAYKPFARGQVRTNEQPSTIGYGAPFRKDLTVVEHAEIERENDFTVQQLGRMRSEEQRRNQPMADTGSDEANIHIVKTRGQWEDEVQKGAQRISGSVVAPMVSRVIDLFDKNAHEVFEEGRRGSNSGGLPTGSAGGAGIFGNIRESNEAKDPEKVLEYLIGQMEGLYKDQSFIDRVGEEADKVGIDRSEYLEQVIRPQIEADLGRQFDNAMIARYLPKNGKEYVLGGLTNSIVGMLSDAFLETKSQRAYKNQAAAMTDEGDNPYYTPGTGARLAQMGVSFAADTPFFGVYGRVSGQVAKGIAERQIQKMMAKGLSEGTARSIVGASLENSVGARMKNYLMQHVVSSSMTLGGYNATSELARQIRDKEGIDLGKIAGSTAEGLATGAAFGVTGGISQALSQPLSGIRKVGAKIAGFGAEAETMYATEELSKMAQGEEGFTNPFEGSVEAVMKLGVMKVSSPEGLTKAIGEVVHPVKSNQRQQVGVHFSKEEEGYIRNSAEGQSLLDALGNMHPDIAISEVNGKKRLTPDGEQMRRTLSESYARFMENPETPATVKQKVAHVLGGVYRPGLETGADITHNADGSVILKTRDKDGNCIREMRFDSFSDAEAWREDCETEFRLNDAVNMWNGTTDGQRAAAVNEIAETLGLSLDDAAKMTFSALDAKDTSLDRDQYNAVFGAIERNAYPEDEYNPQHRYREGRKMTTEERHFAQVDLQLAKERLGMIGPEFAREVTDNAEYADEKMAEIAANPSYGKEEIEAARDYYNALAKTRGMMDEALKGVDEKVEDANALIRRNTHPDSGSLIEVASSDGNFYLTAGHIQITPDGRVQSTDGTGMVILRDRETGEIRVTNPQSLTVTAVNDPKRLIEDNESMEGLRGQLLKQADDSIELHPDTPEVPQEAGEIFVGADGRTYMVSPVSDETGNMVWTKIEVELDENGNPSVKGNPQPIDIDEYRKAKSDEIDAADRPQTVSGQEENIQNKNEGVPNLTEGVPDEVENVPEEAQPLVQELESRLNGKTETPGNEPPAQQGRILVDEKGRKLYEQATPEDALEDLISDVGSEEKAKLMITKMVENTEKALKALQEQDTSGMTDMNDLRAHEKELKALQQKLDFWQSLVKKPEPKVEVDQEGKPFVNASNGTTTFGMIDASKNLDEAPIKLSRGDRSHGYEHIEYRHGDQIKRQGFKSVEEFVEFVANNYTLIKEGVDEGGNPNGTYLLQAKDKHNNTIYIELSKDGSYWNVNSGGVFRKNYGDKLKTVWSASEVQNGESAPDNTLRPTTDTDKSVEPNGTVSDTVSDGKDTKNINTNQENQKKNDVQQPVVDQNVTAPLQNTNPDSKDTKNSDTNQENVAPQPEQAVTQPQPTARQKVAQGVVRNNIGKRYAFQNQDGTRSEVVINSFKGDDKVEVTRQDYDAQGTPSGEPYSQDLSMVDVGNSIVNGYMKPILSTDEKLRKQFKFDRFKQGDVPIIDVLTDVEKQQILDAFERGDKETVGNLTGEFMNAHREDIILKGRDIRNEKAASILNGNAGVEEKLRKLRRLYDLYIVDGYLSDDALYPSSAEDWVSALHSRVPKSGEGRLAYFSYDRDGSTVVGMQDETDFGAKTGGDTKGFAPWLAPKGKGMSLQKYAEMLHGQLPESVQEQYSDQDMRNAVLNVFVSTERPRDIPTMLIRRGVLQAEATLRKMEERMIDDGPSFQKVTDENVFASRLKRAKEQVNTEPTEAQKQAGNYKKGHIRVYGLDISIENPKGSVRRGTDADGKEWETTMQDTYGYIRGTVGADGDQIDVFLSDDPTLSDKVFIVQQRKKVDGAWKFDELKVLLGFDDASQASNAYLSNYKEGWDGMEALIETDMDSFKDWLKNGNQKGTYKEDGAWTKVYPGVSDMVADEREMPKPEQQEVQVLRGERNNNLSGMDREFPEVPGGRGQTAISQGNAGQNRREQGLLQGELQVDGLDNSVTESKNSPLSDLQGQNDVNATVGRGNGASAEENQIQDIDVPLERRENSGNSRRNQGQFQNDNISGQNYENGRLGKGTRSELQNAEEQTETGLDNGKDIHDTDSHRAEGEVKKLDNMETALLDAVVEHLRSIGVEVSTDWKEGQRILDEYNGNGSIKKMGSRVDSKKKQMSDEIGQRELTEVQQAVVDVYTGKSDNKTLTVTRDGKDLTVKMRQGNEQGAGTKHSLFRHYGTSTGIISADDVLLIPDVLANGERTEKRRGKTRLNAYQLTGEDGTKYTVLTEINNRGKEVFNDFYTNRKASSAARLTVEDSTARLIENVNGHTNTQLSAQADTNNASDKASNQTPQMPNGDTPESARTNDLNASSGAKLQQNPETAKDSERKFFKTPDGHAYGYTYKGKLYIDPRIATAETPVHEYGHLWCEMERNTAPDEWNQMKQVMLNDKMVQPIIERVRRDYPELVREGREDDFIEEIITQFSGKRGAERLKEIADEIAKERGGIFGKAEAVTAMQRLKNILNRFWEGVARMMGWKYTNANQIADRIMADMLNGVDPRERMKEGAGVKNGFAARHGIDEGLIKEYEDGIKEENLGKAARAFTDIRRSLRMANKDKKLSEFTEFFTPIRERLFEQYGSLDALREKQSREAEIRAGVMEAARKREEEARAKERERMKELEDMTDDQLDDAYMNALDANDEGRMRDIINVMGDRRGYMDASDYQGEGAWSAPGNPGYESDEARRADVEANSPDVNVTDIAKGYSPQPSDYFLNPRAYGYDNSHGRESARAITKAMAKIAIGGRGVTVKVYRAVPENIDEGTFRNGDWVTPSRKYAEMHGKNRLEGKYRIMEQEVPADHLWWDGNDVNEWGYDDGSGYRYKNTEHNRKLNDLVTRDDEGNVIPPSRRFDEANPDIRFQMTGRKGAAEAGDVAREDQVIIMGDGTAMNINDIKPVGKGDFGDIYDQFKGKPKEAVDFLMKKKGGEAIGALSHKDVGDIDLVWGEEGTGKSDGFGLAKLAKYHSEVLDNLQEILNDMHVVKRTDNRISLESDTHQAAVRLTWNDQKKNWLLTAFEKKNSALGNTTDTGKTPERGKRNDTATPQSTVSDGKDTNNTDTIQENLEENAPEWQKSEDNSLKFQRVGSPEPEMTPEERQYWNQWDKAMKKWRERNAIPDDVIQAPEKPGYQQGESALDYANRLAQWHRQKNLWQTAPKLEDYRQVRSDKDIVDAARENEERFPNSTSAKMRRIAAEALRIRHAMSRQKAYDKATVKAVTDFAQDFMKMGFGDNLGRGDMERMLSSVKNATGAKDVKKNIDNIMNILIDNHLRNLDQQVVKLSSVKEMRQTAQGVEAQGRLELKGQRMIKAFREAREGRMDVAKIRERMSHVAEKMSANDEESPMWEQEYEGLSIALQYQENIEKSRDEYADLDRAYKDAVKEYKQSGRSYKAQQELLESLDQAMMENKIERLGMFGDVIGRLQGDIAESMKGAREFVEKEKERVKKIQAMANADLAGKEYGAFRTDDKGKTAVSGKTANFFLLPLATFEQMLKQFGGRNAKGDGNLYNYFMRGWIDATNNSYMGEVKAKEDLDAKAREVFGGKVERWSDLYGISRQIPEKVKVEVTDVDGTKKELALTQGNLLYIYMANKMSDGAMKLRAMGITEEAVEKIRDVIDPRLIHLGDWLQSEYLRQKRVEYNKVHERMFGAPMAAIDNYFPIRIVNDARYQEEDVSEGRRQNVLPSTVTGSIIRRTRNTLPLDIQHTDALSLALEHVVEMEHWAAEAEWKRDISTLLSYSTFRNKVKNMKTAAYGSGDKLWDAFYDTATMAAGEYRAKGRDVDIDRTISNIAKGVTAAKINFRIYTAFKQILSAPAFIHDVDLGEFVKDGVNPYGSWKWAMENMPVFRKRWESRQTGDTRLMDDPTDWKMWKRNVVQNATRLGMSPNALVDGITCAVGARAIYNSRLKKYKAMGASEEIAHKRALQDAEIGYNLTQQSSEGAFVSAIQMDRTVAANMLTVFRNSSMAYTRQWWDAARNLRRRRQKGYKEDSIDFMARQFQHDLELDEAQARKAAEQEYDRARWHEAGKLLNMMFGVTVAWNLGASLPYLLIGDDEEVLELAKKVYHGDVKGAFGEFWGSTKTEMAKDALLKALIAGPTEGFAAGNIISDMVALASNENVRKAYGQGLGEGWAQTRKNISQYEINPLPLMADLDKLLGKSGRDVYELGNDLFNIWAQSAVGVNPQTFTDFWNACVDVGMLNWAPGIDAPKHNDALKAKEVALFIMRVMNAPASSWKSKYIDELGMDAEDAKKMPYGEMAERYANYKMWKDAPIFGWLRNGEEREARTEKLRQQFDKAVEERMERLTGMELADNLMRSGDPEEKRRLAKIAVRRMGLTPGKTSEKPEDSDWYQKVYQGRMQYEDVIEDETLAAKFKDIGKAYKEVLEEASRKSMQDETDFHKKNKEWKKRIDDAKTEAKKRIDWIRDGRYDTDTGRKGKNQKKEYVLLEPGKRQLDSDPDNNDNEAAMANIRKWRKEALEILLKAEASAK